MPRAPHRLAKYARDIASEFHQFYDACRVLTEDPATTTARLGLCIATKTVLAESQPGDCVAFYPLDGRMAVSYYVRERDAEATAPRPVFPTAPWNQVTPYVERYGSLSPARTRYA